MKKITSTLITCIIFFSCSKDTNNPSPVPSATGSIQYKVNGQLIVIDNVDLLSGQYAIFAKQLKGIIPETRYLLNAQKGINNFIAFTIVTDSLHQMNYHYDSLSVKDIFISFSFTNNSNGQLAGLLFNGDYFDINISSYKNSRVSGTFTAKISPFSTSFDYNKRGSVIISEGVLNNIQMTY